MYNLPTKHILFWGYDTACKPGQPMCTVASKNERNGKNDKSMHIYYLTTVSNYLIIYKRNL